MQVMFNLFLNFGGHWHLIPHTGQATFLLAVFRHTCVPILLSYTLEAQSSVGRTDMTSGRHIKPVALRYLVWHTVPK